MNMSRVRVIASLAVVLLMLIAVGIFGTEYARAFGEVGIRVRHFLVAPLFTMGGLPITLFFLLKAAIFLVALVIFSHFTMLVLQKRVLKHTPLALAQQYAAAKVISYLIFILGLVIGLQSLGVNLNSLVVVGGALGIGVGLGLQAVVANFVAGLILLLEQPIKLGDRIQVGSTYGDVVRLRGRSTWVRTNENVVIIVPNSEFINQSVTNWTANDRQVRISLPLGVSYDSDPKAVREVILAVAHSHADVLHDPAPEVIFTEFGDSSLNFELRVWTIQQVQTPTRLKSDLYFALFEAFRKESIEIPFPQRDLHVRSISEQLSTVLAPQEKPRSA
ncbi:MAG TPA: mechanosensitive ion channel domain-containing protein [Terriglobales bacterium]|jgi:small-conductance mechanosensitive channel